MKMLKLSNFLQAKFNVFLYKSFGWGLIRFYMNLLCRFYFFVKKEETTSIKKSVVNVIGWVKKKNELSDITKKVFSGIFYHYYEKIYLAFENKKNVADFMENNVICKDISVIRKALSRGKGVVLITGHYGAIEYIPILLAMKNINISMIAKFKTPEFKKRGFGQAENFGIRMIDGDNKGSVLKMAINELKQNRVVITQCDEIDEWRTSDKKRMSFLGKITGLDRTINLLCKRSGAEAVFGVMHRFSLEQYKFVAYSREQMINMIKYTTPSTTTGEIVLKVLEQLIYKYPEQWYEWKKYPDIVNTQFINNEEARPLPAPSLQPSFNIRL